MDNSRELDRLLRRATRLTVIKKPPTLTLTVLEPGQAATQEPSLWNLILQIQPKRTSGLKCHFSNSADTGLDRTHQGLA